ncbi:hypothetical protein FKP32DRAFT_1560572, partial [Trametes sanguinea]
YRLCGLIYFGQFHFTSQVVTRSGEVYSHDGIKTGSKLTFKGNLVGMDSKMLSKLGKRKLSVVIYQKI